MSDIDSFIAAMRAAGVDPVEPIAGKLSGGKLIRFRCQGDGKKRNGWAVFLPVAAGGRTRARGRFGNYKQNTGTIEWFAERDGPLLSPEERARIRAEAEAAAARRALETEQAQEAARQAAVTLWRAAPPASPDHPYAAKKRLRVGGLRQQGDALLVPMKDIHGHLWNLQRIYPDGSKRFLKGGRIIGLCARIGIKPGFVRGVFAEGFATGDAVSQALGGRWPVIVAFNTANLEPVVADWTSAFPRADWVIAADDDHLTGLRMVAEGKPYQNPGIDKARAVAAQHGCKVAYPTRRDGDNTDFSDLLLEDRAGEIAMAIDGARLKIDGGGAVLSLAERIGRAA